MAITSVTDTIRNILPLKYCGAVIVAAGNASRMGGIDKVMALLDGEPMIVRTVRTFQNCDAVKEIVVVTREDLIPKISSMCGKYDKVRAVVVGGKDRAESVKNGLSMFSGKVKLAAIQDGARPLITEAVIDRTIRAAHTYGAAAPAVPMKDTIKVVEGGIVSSTPDRSTLKAIQTPQVFDVDLLKAALKKAFQEGAAITDDCSAVELMGFKVKIVEGDERNIKVTTPMDLRIAQMLLEETK